MAEGLQVAVFVREYTPADRDAVLAAFRTNVPAHFAASEEPFLEETLTKPDGPLFVVVDGLAVVGFGGYETSDFYNRGTLVWGLIRADRHKQGLGRLLLAHRLRHMAAANDRPRWAAVDTTPHIAGFYERCGFDVITRWPGGYRSGFDRVDLRLELTAEALQRVAADARPAAALPLHLPAAEPDVVPRPTDRHA